MGCGTDKRDGLLERLDLAEPVDPKSNGSDKKDATPQRRMRLTVLPSSGAVLTAWLLSVLNMGHSRLLVRTKRFLTWLLRMPLRTWRLSYALSGPRISRAAFDKRMAVCNECPSMQIRLLRKLPFRKLYCGPCNCWHWLPAELDRVKNWLLRWKCPQNRHKRLDDPPEWAAIIEKEKTWTKEKLGEDENADVGSDTDRSGTRAKTVAPRKGGV